MPEKTADPFFEVVIILFLILFNGLLAMAEMAVVSSRKGRLLQRAEDGDLGAKRALDLANDSTRFLSTVQIGITLVGILAGAVGGATLSGEMEKLFMRVPVPFIAENARDIGIGLIVLAITYFSLVLGELVPKRLAQIDPERVAALVAGPVGILSRLARPLVSLLSFSTEMVMRVLHVKKPVDSPLTPEEITVLMEQGEQVGMFEEMETDIVESVFRLSDLRAGALMTPRTEIEWIDLGDPYSETLQTLLDSPHSHFPLCEGGLDNIQGILRAKDLLGCSSDGAEPNLSEMMSPAQFIPESMPVYEVLEVLRSATGNLSLVIDEYGGVLGMITLFDVMEALVGGISEVGEPVEPEAVQREDGSWLVAGMMRIDEFKDLLDLDELPLEERVGYQTVGGLIMALARAVPKLGEQYEAAGWRFEVVDMDGLRVDKILAAKT